MSGVQYEFDSQSLTSLAESSQLTSHKKQIIIIIIIFFYFFSPLVVSYGG